MLSRLSQAWGTRLLQPVGAAALPRDLLPRAWGGGGMRIGTQPHQVMGGGGTGVSAHISTPKSVSQTSRVWSCSIKFPFGGVTLTWTCLHGCSLLHLPLSPATSCQLKGFSVWPKDQFIETETWLCSFSGGLPSKSTWSLLDTPCLPDDSLKQSLANQSMSEKSNNYQAEE